MFNLLQKKRLKYSFYGNCQLENICKLLNQSRQFTSIYEFVPVKPVHELVITDIEPIKHAFKDIDLLIYQHVSSSFKNGTEFQSKNILKFTKTLCEKIQIPSLFFNAYFPDFHEVNVEGHGLISTNFFCNYHDMNILVGYVLGLPVEVLEKVYTSENYYEKKFCEDTLTVAFMSLRERETTNKVDIPISDFIETNFRQIKLFNSQNHPKPIIVQYIIDNVLKKLNLKFRIKANKTLLDGLETHIHPAIYKHLELKFDNKIEFLTLTGTIKSYGKLIELYYEQYSKIDLNVLKKALIGQDRIIYSLKWSKGF